MNIYSLASIVTTVLSFLAFIGIVAWAWSSRRREAFDEAANAPFALPDDGAGSDVTANQQRAQRRS
jgi:cytochrome c oxidase cbb3-type subunit IV